MNTRDLRLENDLLNSETWPEVVRASATYPLLCAAANLAVALEERIGGDQALDIELHGLFKRFRSAVRWMPAASATNAPAYTRTPWDLRALAKMIPAGLELKLEQESGPDDEGYVRWGASLFDRENIDQVGHPGELQHNAILFYNSGSYGEAWTPNLAVARILLAALILALIQRVVDPQKPAAPAAPAMPALNSKG